MYQSAFCLMRCLGLSAALAFVPILLVAQEQTSPSFDYRDALVTDEPAGISMPDALNAKFTTGIRIVDGQYLAAESLTKTVTGGPITDDSAKSLKINSAAGGYNGIVVKGAASTFTLSDSVINIKGDGGSDMLGQGAAALALGSVLVLKNVTIETSGKARTGVESINHGVLKVIDSTIKVHGGSMAVTEDYMPKATTSGGPGGTPGGAAAGGPPSGGGAPGGVAVAGSARAALTVDNSTSYFLRSRIMADGWGAISTDGANGYVYVEADDCEIVVEKNGYGFYSDLGSHVVIKSSRIKSGQFAGVIAGPASAKLEDVAAVAEGNGFMVHSVFGSPLDVSKISVKGGSVESRDSTFWVRSANAEIAVDGARLAPSNGKLVEVVKNTDNNATKLHGWRVAGVKATFKNAMLEGSLTDEDPERGLFVTLLSTTLKGALQNASISIDARSKWTATADSTVVLLGATSVNGIDAPSSVTIHASAGDGTTLAGETRLPSGGVLVIE